MWWETKFFRGKEDKKIYIRREDRDRPTDGNRLLVAEGSDNKTYRSEQLVNISYVYL